MKKKVLFLCTGNSCRSQMAEGAFIQYLTKELGFNLVGVKITLELLKKLDVSSDNYYELIREITLKCNQSGKLRTE